MKVLVDGWSWLDKSSLLPEHIGMLRERLTIYPRKIGDHPGDDPKPIYLYEETSTLFGVPREYFLANKKKSHEITFDVTDGSSWPGDLEFNGEPFPEQRDAYEAVMRTFGSGQRLGGLIQAATGWGKTCWTAYLISKLSVPTLVMVHKDLLLNQWRDNLSQFLPGVQIGIVKEDLCELEGKHVVIGMMQTLAKRGISDELAAWPGLVVTDEVHRLGAATWAPIVPRFKARHRLGLSATPTRSDGADEVFLHHIGPLIYAGGSLRLKPKVRKVWSEFRLRYDESGSSFASKTLLVTYLCADFFRNKLIAEQVAEAVQAGRKVLCLSERVKHLDLLQETFSKVWKNTPEYPECPETMIYTGPIAKKLSTKERNIRFDECRVIFATKQLVSEGFDYPPLDTICFSTPIWDAEQAIGRILRPHPGKKYPVAIDIRDDNVPLLRRSGENRDKLYERLNS